MNAPGDDHTSSEGDERAFEEGNRLARQGQLEQAEEAYRKAAEAGNPTAAAYAGVFAEGRNDMEEAEELYRQADEGGDGFGAFRLGLLLSQQDEWDAATEAWSRAQERGHESPPFDPDALSHPDRPEVKEGPVTHRSVFANPVLLGAITVLVLLIGVFLAYNANSGLPFVPTRQLKVDIPNGTAVVVGNQVEAGSGYDIGIVSDMKPVRLPGGQTAAQLILQLSESYGAVPADSRVTIRSRSLLGLKFVSLDRGHSKRMLPDGATLPITQTSVPVQFDDFNKMFNGPTRTAIQHDLVGFGDTLAARGSSLNDTFSALPELLQHLEPVARYLSVPGTQLTRFFTALNSFFGTISPVAQVNARLFGEQATTFEAISRSTSDLEQTIRQSPPTLDVSTDSQIHHQPFLVDLKRWSDLMAPATASLRA
ncbi:MAG: MlaD family protein, partial [Solirubrobacteraceae bacterium]